MEAVKLNDTRKPSNGLTVEAAKIVMVNSQAVEISLIQ